MAAYLFTVEDGIVVPHTETLLISPFKEIWQRDTDEHKELAKLEFTYIEFMTSKKKTNPFKGYDEVVRPEKIMASVKGFPEDWEPDELIKDGMKFIEDVQVEASPTYQLYNSAYHGVKKLKEFFDDFDMNERNPRNGNPVWKPRDITSPLKEVPDLLESMKKLEKKVEEDVYEKTVTKANKEISPFANPD